MEASKNENGLQKRLKQLGLRGLPSLPPVPDLSKYRNDPYADSFLLNYNPPKQRKLFDSVVPGLTRKAKRTVQVPTAKMKLLKYNCTNGSQIGLSLDLTERKSATLASLNHSTNAISIAPLEDACVARILQKIPIKFDPKNREMEELINTVKDDYVKVLHIFTVRRNEAASIESSSQQQSINDSDQRSIGAQTSFIRAVNFSKSQKEVKKRLFLLDPAMRVLLSLCKNMLGNMVILNCRLYSSYGAQTFESLLEHVKEDCTQGEDKILHSWFPQVIKIVSKPATKKCQTKNNAAFYKCVTSVLSAQLKELVHRSVQTLVDVYNDQKGCNFPILKLSLRLETGTVAAKPSVQDLETLITNIVQQILTSLNQIPTIDSWLSDGAITMMETKLPDSVLKHAHETIVQSIRKHFEGPQLLIDSYVKKYNVIIDGQAMKEIVAFLAVEHQFEDYCKLIDHYHDLAFAIRDIPNIEYYPMFSIHCSDLKVVLVEAAYRHRDHVLAHVAQRNREENLRICKCLAHMKGRMKKVPDSMREMTDLVAYVAKLEMEDVPSIKNAVKDSYARLIYLLNLYEFNEDDFTLNGFTLTIPGQLKPLIDNCKEVIEDCKLQFDESLQNRIEKLGVEIEKLQSRTKELELCGTIPMVVEFMQDVRSIDRRIVDLQKVIKDINEEEALFQFPLSNYTELDDVIANVNVFKSLFCLVTKWQKMEAKWMDGDFLELDAETVEQEISNFSLGFHKLQKLFRARQKQREGDGRRSVRWGADKEEGEAVAPPVKLCLATLDRIRQFKMYLPVVNTLCQPGVRPRHWRQMSALVGYQLIPEAGATLRTVLQYDLDPHLEKLETITVAAAKEYTMERAIQKMLHDWDHVGFATVPYRDTGVNVLTAVDEVQLALDDHVVKIQMMRSSPFIQPFEEEVQAWEAKLVRTQETIDEWLRVQSQWMYLEPIFSSRDIVQQMPEEGRLFATVDRNWRAIMKVVARDPKVMSTAGDEDTLAELRHNTSLLEQINHGLNEYLEKKRLYFPRFFFLSNDEMLEILSETKDPLRVQPHLKKCFEGVARLDVEAETLDILAMFSSEGERVQLTRRISTAEANGQVEKWLLGVQDAMLASVKDNIDRARQAYLAEPHEDWVVRWPGQVVLCVSQLYWTSEVHQRLGREGQVGLKSYLHTIDERMRDVVKLVRGQLDGQARITLNSFVVIQVHARDVVQALLNGGVASPSDFQWLSQLRYYWEDGDCLVRIINATVKYAYEYLGNTSRLVITPLTDRCYRTLVGAFHLHLNGAPEGPAGTGKTETVKDLAKALAVQCVVFNCSDGLDYLAMGKFFKGLASSGAWACFDEFNRIDPEVLSVVAQQILTIVQAVRAGLTAFAFEGTVIRLNPNCYTCITQNPGYAGRSELPDNLKALFRTVAMMVPDYVMIAEISLYSYGFLDARSLAVKIVTTYRLCSELLSSQSHYDYGMRAVKTVLATAGAFKLRHPREAEELLVLRSIVDVNLPKFLPHDIPLFEGIVSDLFPGLRLPRADREAFAAAALEACAARGLQMTDVFLQKLVQVYETMTVRHGFMLVGEPLGGKTRLLEVLAATLGLLHERGDAGVPGGVHYRVINPKAVSMGQLYGQFDPLSHEWTDGVVAAVFREFAAAPGAGFRWVVFDGPVDPVWIENMNAVLDDNKKLCLMSGEIIAMPPTMSVVFEVEDLLHASPATVSRCGMVYVEPGALGWRPLAASWLRKVAASEEVVWAAGHEDLLRALCEWLLDAALDFKRLHCRELVAAADGHLATSFLDAVEGLLNDVCRKRRDTEVKYCRFWIVGACTFALVWSVGALCVEESRPRFNVFLRQLLAGKGRPVPPEVGKIEAPFPSEGLVYDYVYEYQQKGQWKHWNDFLWALEAEMDACSSVWQLMVPTMDTVRCGYLVDLALRQGKPLLFVGPTGTGKSAYVRNKLLHGLPKDRFLPAFVSFSAQTSAGQLQDMVVSSLEKRRKGLFGPPLGKRCAVFLDDLHLPAREAFGCQPPLELLRQFFDYGFWYDRKELSRMNLVDLTFLAAMGVSGTPPSPRLLRHFHVVGLNPFGAETLQRIFSAMLSHHLRMGGFTADVFTVIGSIVPATMAVYRAAAARLLPTPRKFHYLFNLRDMARVVLGCCLIRKESAPVKRTFTRLWVHEVLRVFYDRLVDAEDRSWLFEQLREGVKAHFRDNFDVVFDRLGARNRRVAEEDLRGLMFGDYLQPDTLPEERRYEEVASTEMFANVVALAVEEYNNTHKARLSVVVFPYVLEHLSRICRVLRIPGGHCLLVGVSGCGRQTLVRLAASMAGFGLFQPEITKGYGLAEWREDLKGMLRTVGTQGKPTVFLVTDFHIKHESFLEDIDSLLNSGEVPNIFSADEKQELFQALRAVAQTAAPSRAGEGATEPNSPLALFAAFVARCRENLHLVVAFSPQSEAFRQRLRRFPSLINCCTIDWFQPWPADALECVARHFLAPLELEKAAKGLQEAVVNACQHFHVRTRALAQRFVEEQGCRVYVTPTTFLQLLDSFIATLTRKDSEFKAARKRYEVGLENLVFAASQISAMQQELEQLQPQLVEAASKTRKMMTIIQSESKEVEQKRRLLQEDEAVVNVQTSEAKALRDECEADLAQAIPALELAIAALDTLKPADITVLKSMKSPPLAVKLVMEAICVMLDVKPEKVADSKGAGGKILDYWAPSKKILGDFAFLSKLKDYDKDDIPPPIILRIQKDYLPNPEFKPNIVAKASSAAEGLCKWVCAMELYDRTAKIVAPKKAKLQEAEERVAHLIATLNAKREELTHTENHLSGLHQQLNETVEEKKRLESQTDLCALKLKRAKELIDSLGDEKERWTYSAQMLSNVLSHLTGDVLLASGVIAYLGPFTATYRNECLQDWSRYLEAQRIAHSENFSVARTLGDPLQIQTWTIAGLPNDAFSIDNAVIVHSTRKCPLMIDPQGQACKWIKATEQENQLTVIKPSDPDYQRIVEACIMNGRPLLIENMGEDLDPTLEPLLLKQTFKQGGVEMIRFRDKLLEYNPKFRLLMTTKLRNPHYLPEICIKVCLVNFLITIEGLEDQLLGLIVAKEKPDLEEAYRDFVVQSSKNKFALKDIEDKILTTLTSSQGSILEDETAIRILDSSQQLADEIEAKQKVAEETENLIVESRMNYRPVAKHSATLFFCLTDLPNVDPMYQYSLAWFVHLFHTSITHSEKSDVLNERLEHLMAHFTYNVYLNVCRSLFEKDKLLFSFVLCCNLLLAKGEMDKAELMFFLTGGIGLHVKMVNPDPSWIPDQSWQELCRLSDLPHFSNLLDDFVQSLPDWQRYFQSSSPHTEALPLSASQDLSDFQKMCVLRCLRSDKVILAVSNFVSKHLGKQFVQPPTFNLAQSYADSSAVSPLLFVLSPGIDPLSSLQRFAVQNDLSENRLHIVSLGQGQGPFAQRLIEAAKISGDWVLLQNCHLAVSWLPTLEIICEGLRPDNTHQDFRLWLTSYPSEKFPVSILQSSVKMTNEPPTGLRQCLMRVYKDEPMRNPEFFNSCPGKEKTFRKLLFGLCFFHALVSERRKFGSMGWNISYGFNDSDLAISLQQLQLFVNEYSEVPFDALNYMIGECNYGGRVTDDWDRRTLITILRGLCNESILKTDDCELPESGGFVLPGKETYKEYLQFIKNLPAEQDPQVFGLHRNVDISRNLQESRFLWDSVLRTQGQGLIGKATDVTDKSLHCIVEDILKKLPANFNLEVANKKYPLCYGDSMNTVLVQEMERYNRLLATIRDSLKTLEKAVAGLVLMTGDLELVASALLIGKIPTLWADQSYPSLKPLGSYVSDLLERLTFLEEWYQRGKPAIYWLPGFYFTQAFLTAVLQNHARKYTIPIDKLVFDFQVMQFDETQEAPPDGVYVNGLFLEGARWDRIKKHLAEQLPDKLWDPVPIIWLLPTLKEDLKPNGRYPCPLYKTRERKGSLSTTGHSTNYLLTVLLNSDHPLQHWIKRGTALMCQLDS